MGGGTKIYRCYKSEKSIFFGRCLFILREDDCINTALVVGYPASPLLAGKDLE